MKVKVFDFDNNNPTNQQQPIDIINFQLTTSMLIRGHGIQEAGSKTKLVLDGKFN